MSDELTKLTTDAHNAWGRYKAMGMRNSYGLNAEEGLQLSLDYHKALYDALMAQRELDAFMNRLRQTSPYPNLS